MPRSEVAITLDGADECLDEELDNAISSKIRSSSSSSLLRKLLKWLIIIGTLILFCGCVMGIPEKKMKKPLWRKILLSLAGLDLLYVLLPGAFSNFGHSSLFSLELLAALQCIIIYLTFRHDRSSRKAAILFLAVIIIGGSDMHFPGRNRADFQLLYRRPDQSCRRSGRSHSALWHFQ